MQSDSQPFYAAVLCFSYLTWMGAGLLQEDNTLLGSTPPGPRGCSARRVAVLTISDDVVVELRLYSLVTRGNGTFIDGSVAQSNPHQFTQALERDKSEDDSLNYEGNILSLELQRRGRGRHTSHYSV
ncbi:hypothetical protein CUR178_00968 [Leishmania enriettii]|uniref:Uncharacterized protein n=1 Tax=Leishmania enriettii TaxID=5663 RepID=A0A836G3M4_LEIEN|nr:hypothetical protein CUR178_00968 [Leishmania enriettii]